MRAIVKVVFVCSFLSLFCCSCAGQCNQSLLDKFLTTQEAKFSSQLMIPILEGGASKDNGWAIGRQGDGCFVVYRATINSRKGEWFRWFIDLETLSVYPDNDDAKAMIDALGWEPSVISR